MAVVDTVSLTREQIVWRASAVFLAINATALSLAAILAGQAGQMGYSSDPGQTMILVLALTACIAIPVSALAAQHQLDLERLKAALLQLEPIDQITGLLDRRFFELVIKDELGRMERTGRPSAVAIFEVDHFEAIKERYGKSFSHVVLKQVSIVAHAQLRGPFDKVSRWTDDSFIVLMHDVSIAQAEHICNRLRQNLTEMEIYHKGYSSQVTMSFGVSSFAPGAAISDVLKRARAGLQMSQRFGGNKVSNGALSSDITDRDPRLNGNYDDLEDDDAG